MIVTVYELCRCKRQPVTHTGVHLKIHLSLFLWLVEVSVLQAARMRPVAELVICLDMLFSELLSLLDHCLKA